MNPFRLVPALLVLVSTQLGLFLALRAIFLPHAAQAVRRRLLAAGIIVAGLSLPIFISLMRTGVQLSPALRWLLVYPLLSWNLFSFPLILLLGLGLSLARRWPQASGLRAIGISAASPIALAMAPSTSTVRTVDPLPTELPASGSGPALESAPGDPPALSEPRRVFLARAATGLLGASAVLTGFGAWEAEDALEVTRHDVRLAGLHPDLDGLTLLQLSDIHSGALVTEERMRAMALEASKLGADVIVFTGDLLDASARAGAPYTRAFEGLHGKLGTFAILGNHDYYAGLRASVRAMGDAGQTLLRNRGQRLERGRGSLWLGGVDDPMARDGGGEVDPVRALRGAAPEEARVMLAHRPGLFELCSAAGAQLVLSGHTHGGQIAFSPRFSMARVLGPYTMGYYQRGTAQLYVHRGMGVVGPVPVRLGSRPELALFTLRRA